jgi:hypothetical protein
MAFHIESSNSQWSNCSPCPRSTKREYTHRAQKLKSHPMVETGLILISKCRDHCKGEYVALGY